MHVSILAESCAGFIRTRMHACMHACVHACMHACMYLRVSRLGVRYKADVADSWTEVLNSFCVHAKTHPERITLSQDVTA